jgi:FtsH-binding integral membrane protein
MSQIHYGGEAVATPGIGLSSRAAFIARTYNHLLAAIVGFTALEVFYFQTGVAETIGGALLGINWLFVLGGFMIVSWFASRAAHASTSVPTQYLALCAFVFAESIVFVPLLYMANHYAPGTIQSAATMTLIAFAGLTAIAFTTRKDFSFLGGLLRWGFVLALVGIVGAVMFGFQLGTWFSLAMIGLAGAAILYDTSNILREFPDDRHVAAAMQLFASVALMFWYVLSFFLNSRD